jgi:hypothetical protein
MNPMANMPPHPMDAMMFNRANRNGTNPKNLAIRDARGNPNDGHVRGGRPGPHEGGHMNQVHAT